ncbi:hypothetical protein HDU97_009452 [Phlyctochytrium planicorne]|nr:hypothetical protein HDU97_009452 [Phlyctochytrium planicorne]
MSSTSSSTAKGSPGTISIMQKPPKEPKDNVAATNPKDAKQDAEEDDDWENSEPVAIPVAATPAAPEIEKPSGFGAQVIENINSNRTEYVPQIKIMRRDQKFSSSNAQNSSSASSSTPSPTTSSKSLSGRPASPGMSNSTTKSLAERDAEYRAARMRILGKEEPEPDESSSPNSETPSGNTGNVRPSRTSTPPIRNNSNSLADNHPRIWTPTNQVNPIANSDRNSGLSRQPLPPPNNISSMGWGPGIPVNAGMMGRPGMNMGATNYSNMPGAHNTMMGYPSMNGNQGYGMNPSVGMRPQQYPYPMANGAVQNGYPMSGYTGYQGTHMAMANGASSQPYRGMPATEQYGYTAPSYMNAQQAFNAAGMNNGAYMMYDNGGLDYSNPGFVPYDPNIASRGQRPQRPDGFQPSASNPS